MRAAYSWALGILALAPQGLHFESPSGNFVLNDFDAINFDVNGLHATVKGKPFQVDWKERGLTLTGANAVLDAAKSLAGQYYLTSGKLSGGLIVSQDSRVADQFQAKLAMKQGHPAPAAREGFSQMTLHTEAADYSGNANRGTLELPEHFDFSSAGHSPSGDTSATIHGQKGTMIFDTAAVDLNSLKTGSIDGPVRLHWVRHYTGSSPARPDDVIDATAGRLDLDFSGKIHTATLSDNVAVSGSSDSYSGSSTASKAVITFGADGLISKIEMTGTPTETRIKPRTKGGGR